MDLPDGKLSGVRKESRRRADGNVAEGGKVERSTVEVEVRRAAVAGIVERKNSPGVEIERRVSCTRNAEERNTLFTVFGIHVPGTPFPIVMTAFPAVCVIGKGGSPYRQG
jgi:hypothetical protein